MPTPSCPPTAGHQAVYHGCGGYRSPRQHRENVAEAMPACVAVLGVSLDGRMSPGTEDHDMQ